MSGTRECRKCKKDFVGPTAYCETCWPVMFGYKTWRPVHGGKETSAGSV